MLKWLFGRASDRLDSLQSYLSNFSADEIDVLNDFGLEDLFAARNGDWSKPLDVYCAVYAAKMTMLGKVEGTPAGWAAARASVRIKLAKRLRELQPYSSIDTFYRRVEDYTVSKRLRTVRDERLSLHLWQLRENLKKPNEAKQFSDYL